MSEIPQNKIASSLFDDLKILQREHEELKATVREYQDLRDQLDDWRSWKGEEIKRQAILQAADEKFEEIRDLVK